MRPGGTPELYRVRDLLVDVEGASVSRQGERIVLPPRTFELLVALVRRHPCTVRRHDLLDTIWPEEHVTDQTLSHRVMVLRKALGDHAEEPVYVAGERGFGYRLTAPVERICPEEHPAVASSPPAVPPLSRTRGGAMFVGAAAIVFTLGLAAAGLVSKRWAGPRTPRGDGSRLAAQAADPAGPEARARRLSLHGQFFWLSFTEDGLRHSAEAWEQAVALEPDQASAHAGRALAEGVRALQDHLTPAEAEPRVRGAARRALELDPTLPAAHLAQSLTRLLFDWDAAGAVAEARTALEADPDDLRGPIVLALALQGRGRLGESAEVLDRAALDDPYSPAALFLMGRTQQMGARWSEATAAYTRALALEPDFAAARRGSAECLTAAGREKQALVALGVTVQEGAIPGETLHAAWQRLCRAGRTSAETVRACVLGGDMERAERLLAAAVDGRWPFVVLTPHEALLQPLREQPVLQALAVRLQQPNPR